MLVTCTSICPAYADDQYSTKKEPLPSLKRGMHANTLSSALCLPVRERVLVRVRVRARARARVRVRVSVVCARACACSCGCVVCSELWMSLIFSSSYLIRWNNRHQDPPFACK